MICNNSSCMLSLKHRFWVMIFWCPRSSRVIMFNNMLEDSQSRMHPSPPSSSSKSAIFLKCMFEFCINPCTATPHLKVLTSILFDAQSRAIQEYFCFTKIRIFQSTICVKNLREKNFTVFVDLWQPGKFYHEKFNI